MGLIELAVLYLFFLAAIVTIIAIGVKYRQFDWKVDGMIAAGIVVIVTMILMPVYESAQLRDQHRHRPHAHRQD